MVRTLIVTLIVTGVLGFLAVSTVFKSLYELPREVSALNKKMSDLEAKNSAEHSDLTKELLSLREQLTHLKPSKN